MDDKTKYFGLGIMGGFIIVIVIIILIGLLPFLGIFNSTDVCVIPVYGELGYSSENGGAFVNPDDFQTALNDAENDPSVGAIVLDINSAGGSSVASEEMMEMVKNTSKPTVAWISESGTSGAYLLASGCDRIVTTNASMIGNIGAIITLTDLSDYYNKTGINTYSIKSEKYKDMGADYRNLTDDERKILQNLVDSDGENFKNEIAANRNLSKQYVDKISDGQIYNGKEARDKKLVDIIGSKNDAINIASKLGNLSDSYNVKTINPNDYSNFGLISFS